MGWRILLLVSLLAGTSLAAPEERLIGGSSSTKDLLRSTFMHHDVDFSQSRHPTEGPGRARMLKFIQEQIQHSQLRASQKEFAATNYTQTFDTDIMVTLNHQTVSGTNVILVLHGSVNLTDDEPIMLVANYDTGRTSNNVNEGSGVVALLTILSSLLEYLPDKSYDLKNSVIFAFTDVAQKKYDEVSTRGTTGVHHLVDKWLPAFLDGRKGFKGAVVLDNILNFNNTDDSELVKNINMDKSFSTTYLRLAENRYAGNFIGLVHRNNDKDSPMADRIEKSWDRVGKDKDSRKPSDGQTSQPSHSTFYDAKLIRFEFTPNIFNSEATLHFLKSEQATFWNTHPTIGQWDFPAVALTDTRSLRYGCRSMCSVREMVTDDNLDFMVRTVRTVGRYLVEEQTVDNGAFGFQASYIFLAASAILAIMSGRM